MPIDERDYHSYQQLSEEEKERRLQGMRNRFGAALPDEGIVLKQKVRTNTGSHYVSAVPFVLLAIICLYIGSYFFKDILSNATKDRPVINLPAQQQPISTAHIPQSERNAHVVLERGNRERPTNTVNAQIATVAPKPVQEATKPENAQAAYRQKISNAPEDCKREKSALKELECINRAENRQKQAEPQSPKRVTGDWMEKYEKQRHPLVP